MAQDGIRVHVYGDYDNRDINKAIKDLEALKKQSRDLSTKFQDMGKSMQRVGDKISSVGGTLTKGVTLPIVGVGVAATAAAVEFESSMSKITGLVGIAAEEVAGMEAAVLDLAGETAKAPNELADALFVVTSAGLRGKEALDALEFAAKAGAAGLGETNDIARALAGSMNAYGSDVVDAAKATDVIVATARAGNFETSQFASAIGRVLPFAKQAGASLEDLGGSVALLTRTNGDAAQSVTQVQALFRAFVTPTAEATKALDKVGLSAEDMRQAISEQGLPAALQMLDDRLGGNREQLGRLLGSSEAAAAAFQILDADGATLAGTFGAVNDAAGITDEAFNVVAETTGFTLQQALTQLKTTLIEIGDIIAPFVQQFVGKLQMLADAFKNLTPAQKEMAVQFAAVAAAIGPVLLIVGKVISVIGGIIAVFNPLTLKIALVVAAVAALAAGFMYLWNNSEQLRDTVQQAFDRIKAIVTTVIDEVKRVLAENSDELEKLRSAFAQVMQFIADYVVPALVTFYSVYLEQLIKFLGLVVTGIIEVIAFWVRFVSKLVEVGTFIAEWVVAAKETIDGFITGLQTSFTAGFNAISTFIGDIFDSIYTTITETIKSAVNFVIGGINRIINAWNGLSFTTPSVTVGVGELAKTFGPYTVGTNKVTPVPFMAEGGIVTQATLAVIGEAGPEAVIPLPQVGSLGGSNTTINLTVNAGLGTDGAEVGRQIVDALKAYERRNGAAPCLGLILASALPLTWPLVALVTSSP